MGRRSFQPEFRVSAVAMVLEQKRAVAEVASNLGIDVSTLRYWIKEHQRQHTRRPQEELDRIRAQLPPPTVVRQQEKRYQSVHRDQYLVKPNVVHYWNADAPSACCDAKPGADGASAFVRNSFSDPSPHTSPRPHHRIR